MSDAPGFGLTPTQASVLRVIQELTALDGCSPTYEQIARECGFSSKSNVAYTIKLLIDRGHLAHLPRQSRSLVVLREIPALPDFEFEVTAAGRAAVGVGAE